MQSSVEHRTHKVVTLYRPMPLPGDITCPGDNRCTGERKGDCQRQTESRSFEIADGTLKSLDGEDVCVRFDDGSGDNAAKKASRAAKTKTK